MPATLTRLPSTTRAASHNSTSPDGPQAAPVPSRDPWFDNAKLLLVTLVVLGHSWTLVGDSFTTSWAYNFLYLWHVPAFVMVTGYLSRSFRFSRRHLSKLLTTVVVPYLVFEYTLTTFRSEVGGEHFGPLFLNPHWPMWYLATLFVWRLATPAAEAAAPRPAGRGGGQPGRRRVHRRHPRPGPGNRPVAVLRHGPARHTGAPGCSAPSGGAAGGLRRVRARAGRVDRDPEAPGQHRVALLALQLRRAPRVAGHRSDGPGRADRRGRCARSLLRGARPPSHAVVHAAGLGVAGGLPLPRLLGEARELLRIPRLGGGPPGHQPRRHDDGGGAPWRCCWPHRRWRAGSTSWSTRSAPGSVGADVRRPPWLFRPAATSAGSSPAACTPRRG